MEASQTLRLVAFSCLHDGVLLVRGALEEIISQLSVSHCLLAFSESETSSSVCKEVISQPALFQQLSTENGDDFLLKSLFLGDTQLSSCCWVGPKIPALWIRYEILLEICTSLGKNDGLSADQLNQLRRLLTGQEGPGFTGSEEYSLLLNDLLRLLMSWRDAAPENTLGQLVNAFERVGLPTIAAQLQESMPVFVLKEADDQMV